ncbi:MAG: hypothetical protein V3T60_16010 [Candidatus Binatia bacterium]
MDAIRAELLAKECGSLTRLYEFFERWLLLKDPYFLEVVLAVVVANLLGGDPLWLLIVAPPSSAKTEIIRALSRLSCIYLLSNLTANTLLSGQQGKKDASLLPHLSNKILAMKDFTTILTLHRDARAEIFAQLREVYDGAYSKAYGTGEQKRWEGRVGFLAGVTQVIDGQQAVHTMLGERFLLYRPETEARQEIARKALRNTGTEARMRKELSEAVEGFMVSLGKVEDRTVEIPQEVEDIIVILADLIAKGRAGVARDGYDRLIRYSPEPETPARLAKQLALLGKGLAILRGKVEVGIDELAVLRKVAVDTMTRQRVKVVRVLAKLEPWEWAEKNAVIQGTHIPARTCGELLEDCWMLGIIERDVEGDEDLDIAGKRGRKPYKWRLSDDYRHEVEVSGIFEKEAPF